MNKAGELMMSVCSQSVFMWTMLNNLGGDNELVVWFRFRRGQEQVMTVVVRPKHEAGW